MSTAGDARSKTGGKEGKRRGAIGKLEQPRLSVREVGDWLASNSRSLP